MILRQNESANIESSENLGPAQRAPPTWLRILFFSREVAIKIADINVLQDPMHGQRYKKLFLNKASLAGKLKHPHIVSIHDAGVDDDRHYLVMEYVPGNTLERCCDTANLLPFSEVVDNSLQMLLSARLRLPPGCHTSRYQAGQHHARSGCRHQDYRFRDCVGI